MFNWWTFFFQTLNFFIVMAILYRLFFRPLKRVIDDREEVISQRLETLEREELRLKEEQTAYEEQMKEMQNMRQKVLEEAKKEALILKDNLLKEHNKELSKSFEKQSAIIKQEQEKYTKQIRHKSLEFSLEYTKQLLDQLNDEFLHVKRVQQFLHSFDENTEEIIPLKEQVSGKTCTVTIDTPFQMTEDLLQHIEEKLSTLLGCQNVAFTVIEDASLICGIRLRVDNQILDGSFKAVLEAFRTEMESEI